MNNETKVIVMTFTRDRLLYTKHCFNTLVEKAGYPYQHIVIDNGSTDGTWEWLDKNKDENKYNIRYIRRNNINEGLTNSIRQAIDITRILKIDYDLLIKVDNDCEVVSNNIIKEIVEIYKIYPDKYMFGPICHGLCNKPKVLESINLIGNKTMLKMAHIGGIFMTHQKHIIDELYNLKRMKDNDVTEYLRSKGWTIGYLDYLHVNHYETTVGQHARFPDYFKKDYKI